MAIWCILQSTDPNVGLSLNEERTTLKCYMGDTGLLISMAFDDHGRTDAEIYKKLLFDKLEVNKGMLTENIVAQMLRVAGHKLYFFTSSKDDSEKIEIDFMISKSPVTSRHNISPIEVKSANQYTLLSLKRFIAKYDKRVGTPYVIHTKDLEIKEGVVFLPIYMTSLI